MTLVLSLFPGLGLLDRAFEDEGFCVVRAPDLLWGGDIKRFPPPADRFDGIIGGPPCTWWSRMANIARAQGFTVKPDMIPEFVRCVRAARPRWFLMENVEAAPPPIVPGYIVSSFLLNNRWLGEKQNRLRRFSFGHPEGKSLLLDSLVLLEDPDFEPAVLANGMRQVDVKIGGSGKTKRGRATIGRRRTIGDACELQGLPRDFFGPDSPFTQAGKALMVGNGVPQAVGRALARAVKQALTTEIPTPAPVIDLMAALKKSLAG